MNYFHKDCKVTIIESHHEIKKPISDIKVGDILVTYDELSEEWTNKKVTKVLSDKKISDFKNILQNLGYKNIGLFTFNNLNIKFTPTTSFLTLMGWRAIYPSNDYLPYSAGTPKEVLDLNDNIYKAKGYWECINHIDFLKCNDDILYSLIVEENHSYLVDDIVVFSN